MRCPGFVDPAILCSFSAPVRPAPGRSIAAMATTLDSNHPKLQPIQYVVVAATWLVVVLILLPPFVGVGARTMLMGAFSSVCHQIADRSSAIDGVQIAVCHRCFGIFAGLAVASTVFAVMVRGREWLKKRAGAVILAAVVPVSMDWGADALGLWSNTSFSRTLTGAVFGLSMGALLVASLTPGSSSVSERGN